MHSDSPPPRGRHTRRQFIRRTGAVAAAAASFPLLRLPADAASGTPIAIVFDRGDTTTAEPPARWAVDVLRETLTQRGFVPQSYETLEQVPSGQECILVAGRPSSAASQLLERAGISLPESREAVVLARGQIAKRPVLLACGSDTRGLVYALLDVADRVQFADNPLTALKSVKPIAESPAGGIRSVARAFVSDVEDKSWFNDRSFWSRYLTMLAAQRFNRFSLTLGIGYDFTTDISDCYFHFAYPFLLTVPGYDVRAVSLPDAERDANLEMLKFISAETARRGLHFQLGLWTHAYQWSRSPRANYTIEGLTPETHAPYCRDALRALLGACPAISGITFRIHGESGVAEGNYDLWKTIFDGVVQCGRTVEIDMHAKGMDQGMIDVAVQTGMPLNISPKFWAEHMGLPYMQGAIRPQEMPPRNARNTGFFSRSSGNRSFLRYGYGDLFDINRRYGVLHRIWPGTQRVLLWGDPDMAAAYGRASTFCGSAGIELFEPLFFKGRKGSGLPGGRDGYADASLRPAGGDFEKYLYTYRVWGRNLYRPGGDPDAWRRWLRAQFGNAAEPTEAAIASASRILPLITTAHCPSAANNNYWPEMYFNMSIVDANARNPYGDTPSPKRFGTVSSLDPEFFLGIDEFADELLRNEFSGKYSPAWVAARLDNLAGDADAQLRKAQSKIRARGDVNFRRLALDVKLQSGLGKFFAQKFRAGILYALYLRSGHGPALEKAIVAYRAAQTAWNEMANSAKEAYRRDLTFGPEYFQRGHWLDRLAAINEDVAAMEKVRQQPAATPEQPVDPKRVDDAIRQVLVMPKSANRRLLTHPVPENYNRNFQFTVQVQAAGGAKETAVSQVRLRYRHVNQAETWNTLEMEKNGAEYRAVIPQEFTKAPYPLQYYFQARNVSGDTWIYPGLEPGWNGQPYFFLLPS